MRDPETSSHELLLILSEAVPSSLDIIQVKALIRPVEQSEAAVSEDDNILL